MWGQGFGDYERRSGTGSPGTPALGIGIGATNQTMSLARDTSTWGFSGGLDATFHNVGFLNDIILRCVSAGVGAVPVSIRAGPEGSEYIHGSVHFAEKSGCELLPRSRSTASVKALSSFELGGT
jgi:hypothetical protein